MTEGFIERVLEVCELVRIRMKEYNDLFTFNHAFLKRTAGVGIISVELAQAAGLTGPSARAAGLAFDVRRAHPYLNYAELDFEVPVGRGSGGVRGDAHDRFLVRLHEISESLGILTHLAETIPQGPFLRPGTELDTADHANLAIRIPRGEAYVRVESSRGLLGCHVISDGGEKTPHGCSFGFRPWPGSRSSRVLSRGSGLKTCRSCWRASI